MNYVKDYYVLLYCFFLGLTLYFGIKCYLLKNKLCTQKEYFIKTLGHDFRVSVIAQIRGLDLVRKSDCINKENSELLNEISNSCKYTLDMITTLHKIYSIENKDQSFAFQRINIDTEIGNIFDELYKTASEKNILLKLNCKCNNIIADKENFIKALKILINVAIQHSKQNSIINISNTSASGANIIKIYYNGCPLSYEEQNRMFSDNPNFSTVGHGMKMHLCKKILDLHKCKLDFKSYSNNNNAFEIFIPQKICFVN